MRVKFWTGEWKPCEWLPDWRPKNLRSKHDNNQTIEEEKEQLYRCKKSALVSPFPVGITTLPSAVASACSFAFGKCLGYFRNLCVCSACSLIGLLSPIRLLIDSLFHCPFRQKNPQFDLLLLINL